MQNLPLIGGAYSARSVIANAQRCVNLYPELNREDSPTKVTHYQRPGLVPLATPGTPGAGRCTYQASNGDCYIAVGSKVYFVDSSWALHSIGTIDNSFNTPVSMVDNGTELVIVTGSPYAGNATGYITFTVNPSPGDTSTWNGVVYTFITGPTSGTNIQIGSTLGFTIAALVIALNASTNPAVASAYYQWTTSGSNSLANATYKTPGAIGESYTLAASAGTPSGGTLSVSNSPVPGPGWTVDLGDLTGATFALISDPAWTGATRVDYIDTFVVWNQPGTRNFGSTLSNQILPLDSTYVAGKVGWPDQLQSIIVNRELIMLAGLLKSELWYNNGGALFPFARLPGTYIEHGLVAKYSIASADVNIYWLSKDLQGQGIVLRQRGNETTKRISNYALEFAIREMYASGVDITDAVGYTYQADGHLFYVLNFPSGNQTWVWDESMADPNLGWSQRCWVDGQGNFNRDRGILGASFYGKNVCIDWQNGTLYQQSATAYVDTVGGQDYPITYLRTFPHLMLGTDPRSGQGSPSNGHIVQHERFAINAECGNASPGVVPKFMLRWSDDRGKSWGNAIPLVAGAQGEYDARPDARALGQAMDRVYELSWTFAGQVALNGAWVEGKVLNQ